MSEETIQREVLKPSDVAAIFAVDAKTVCRWSDERRLPSFRTLGGHRRFYADDVERLRRERESLGARG